VKEQVERQRAHLEQEYRAKESKMKSGLESDFKVRTERMKKACEMELEKLRQFADGMRRNCVTRERIIKKLVAILKKQESEGLSRNTTGKERLAFLFYRPTPETKQQPH